MYCLLWGLKYEVRPTLGNSEPQGRGRTAGVGPGPRSLSLDSLGSKSYQKFCRDLKLTHNGLVPKLKAIIKISIHVFVCSI